MPILDTFFEIYHCMVILTLVGAGCYTIGKEFENSV